MKKIILMSLWLSVGYAVSDVLVLKNGQLLVIPGQYTVHGQFVRYKDADGQLLQIPLKRIDLEASEKATLEARKLQQDVIPEKKAEPVNKATLSDIANDLDRRREAGYEAPVGVKIDSKSVKKYEDQRFFNESYSGSDEVTVESASDILARRGEVTGNYNKLADEISKLDKQIQALDKTIRGYQEEINFGDNPNDTPYSNLKDFEAKRDELIQKRREKYKTLDQIKKEAKVLGNTAVARKRPVKKFKPRKYEEEESMDDDGDASDMDLDDADED
jgi:hypothetical protein